MNRVNYLYVDYENVQGVDLARIAGKPLKVALILGKRHKSLPLQLVKHIQKFPNQVRLVETPLEGKNSLDFVLAYEIGAQSEKDRDGYFHIISADKGFDALVEHLKGAKIHAARHPSFDKIPLLMDATERFNYLASFYKAHQINRPKRKKTLASQIASFFGALSPAEIEESIQGLVSASIISVSENGVIIYKN